MISWCCSSPAGQNFPFFQKCQIHHVVMPQCQVGFRYGPLILCRHTVAKSEGCGRLQGLVFIVYTLPCTWVLHFHLRIFGQSSFFFIPATQVYFATKLARTTILLSSRSGLRAKRGHEHEATFSSRAVEYNAAQVHKEVHRFSIAYPWAVEQARH